MSWDGGSEERAEAQIVKERAGRRLPVRVACALLAFAVALPAMAEQNQTRVLRDGNGWVQESTGSLPAEKALLVSRFVGAVQVVTGAQTGSYAVRVHSDAPLEKDARKQFAGFHLAGRRRSGEVLIQTLGPVDMSLHSDLIIHLPAATSVVHVDTLSGKITIQGDVDHLDLQSHGGDIELDGAKLLRAVTMGGSVIVNNRVEDSIIRTGGGDIRIAASLGDLDITSLGGNIWLKAIARAQVQSGGGNIEVVRCHGLLQIHSAGGNINLGEMGGEVTVETGGGNIRVGVAHGPVLAITGMGNIELWKLSQGAAARTGMGRITAEFVGDRNSMKNSELVNLMGDIVVFFAGSASGNLHALTATSPSHRILSEFPELKISTGVAGYGPRSVVAEGIIHGGGPIIEMRTMVGQIELRNAH